MGKTYRKPHKLPLAKRSRTIPIYGRGDDANRYYHCWFCGFVCDVERDALGGADSGSGVGHVDALEPSGEADGQVRLKSCLGGMLEHYHVAQKLGPDGETPYQVYHNYKANISSGCPFCGSKNWRGDY